MRLSTPRIAPLPESEWTEQARATIEPTRAMAGGKVFNIFRTLANHPKLAKRWMVFANHILVEVDAAAARARDRDPAHRLAVPRGVRVGPARRDRQARAGSPTTRSAASAWARTRRAGASSTRALLRATDELHADAMVTDATWKELARFLNTQQLMDVVFTVGQYNLVSMALNSFGVQLDAGLPRMRGEK